VPRASEEGLGQADGPPPPPEDEAELLTQVAVLAASQTGLDSLVAHGEIGADADS
jgi:hypothetical protein